MSAPSTVDDTAAVVTESPLWETVFVTQQRGAPLAERIVTRL